MKFLTLILMLLPSFIISQTMINSVLPAKFEPPQGVYIGAFIANDPVALGNPSAFETLTGKKHTGYLNYAFWGNPFPAWAESYAAAGAAIQIGFEPDNGLQEVTDGEYIRAWAAKARDLKVPVFLRFASEMNGNWTAWHGNPSLYKEKFRLVSTIMKEVAPNVAMVWCPNNIPHDTLNPAINVHNYYPGDEYVDWVGIDFYMVYLSSGQPDTADPRSKFEMIYNRYAATKPIMIGEWAAAHFTNRVQPPADITAYCIAAIDSLYRNINQYPRLKGVYWFSANTLSQNGSNFSLTMNQQVLNAYSSAITSPLFKSSSYLNVPFITTPDFPQDTILTAITQIPFQTKCEELIDSVVVLFNGEPSAHYSSGNGSYLLEVCNRPDGKHQLKFVAYSASGYSNFHLLNIIIDKERNYINTIVDDIPGASFQATSGWLVSSSQPDRYGAHYHYAQAGDGSQQAIYTIDLPKPGTYNVFAWWSQHSNRASDTPYDLSTPAGSHTVRVNQKVDGGKWNLLHRLTVTDASILQVSVNNAANGIVIADAVRVEWVFPTSLNHDGMNIIMPNLLTVSEAYPNPFNPSTQLILNLSKPARISASVYSVTGELIQQHNHGILSPGSHSIIIDLSTSSSGAYFIQCTATGTSGSSSMIRKVLLIR